MYTYVKGTGWVLECTLGIIITDTMFSSHQYDDYTCRFCNLKVGRHYYSMDHLDPYLYCVDKLKKGSFIAPSIST